MLVSVMRNSNMSQWLNFQWKHLKDCFTSISPSDNNYHFRPYHVRMECMDCKHRKDIGGEKTTTIIVPVFVTGTLCCPNCGSTALASISTAVKQKMIEAF